MKGPLEEGQQGREYWPDTKPIARTQTLGKVSNGMHCCCGCTAPQHKVSSGVHLSCAAAADSVGRLHLRSALPVTSKVSPAAG